MFFKWLSAFLLLCALCACREDRASDNARILRISPGKRIATLDPALAADTSSQYMVGAFYDTPLQYSYMTRPYRLEPAMLESLPEISSDMRTFRCRLKKGLLFQKSGCFPDDRARQVTSHDMVFSILRLADARIQSTGYWLVRDKIRGIDKFREATRIAPRGNMEPYDRGCEGLRVVDGLTFEIELEQPDPRFVFALAMPYFSAVSRRAVEAYGEKFADRPAGSGPFVLTRWDKDYVIKMKRNAEFREEYFRDAQNPADRTRKLPLLDEAVCYLVKQPLAAWLMFLQGELDYCALDGENFDALVNENGQLSPALARRGIRLFSSPQFEVNYIGFHFADPRLGSNRALRRAISLAFDKELRSKITNGRLLPIYGPLPPGTDGYMADYRGPYGIRNLELARKLMAEAGFPNGIDPATGEGLEIAFDQAGSDTFYRQTAELLATDLKQIGIKLKPAFNNRARFFQKLSQGQVQMFRLSWTGDYPDAENFFQLFYSGNAEGCNRVFYKNSEFDMMYEKIRVMPPCPERTALYEKMTEHLAENCPWIFESQPVAFILTHQWMQNYRPHDFGFGRWKYLSVDAALREKARKEFTPLSMKDLRK